MLYVCVTVGGVCVCLRLSPAQRACVPRAGYTRMQEQHRHIRQHIRLRRQAQPQALLAPTALTPSPTRDLHQ